MNCHVNVVTKKKNSVEEQWRLIITPQGPWAAGDTAVLGGGEADTTEHVAAQKLRSYRCVTALTSQCCFHSSGSHTYRVLARDMHRASCVKSLSVVSGGLLVRFQMFWSPLSYAAAIKRWRFRGMNKAFLLHFHVLIILPVFSSLNKFK